MTKAEFLELSREYPVVPVRATIPADTETPVSTYLKTASKPWSFLLESVEGGSRWGRYSLVGFDPFLVFEARGRTALVREAGRERVGDAVPELRRLLSAYRVPHLPGLPRFAGGLVGYLGYGTAALFERVPRSDDPAGLPDARLFAPRKLLAFDNLRKTLELLVFALPGDGAEAAWSEAQADLEELREALRRPLPEGAIMPAPCEGPALASTWAREGFEAAVRRAKDAISAGEAIQIVLSQVFRAETQVDPFTAYRALRALNPSPYLFHLRLAEETLVGASPEVMVRVEGRSALLRPIAGTRPRGATPEEDQRLEAELLTDEKERAEHVMLVDLGRNDLGRVAPPGSVRLEESFAVERYSHVMHLVSTVSAALGDSVDAVDVLAATFPAGTVSGAPKVRAMELIEELEPEPRGIYAGAVGYLGFDGAVDTCIAIRTMVFHEGRVRLQAGAGIVADSDPAREYEETLHKARALRRALEVAAGGLRGEGPESCSHRTDPTDRGGPSDRSAERGTLHAERSSRCSS